MVRWVCSRRPRWCANTTEATHQAPSSSAKTKGPVDARRAYRRAPSAPIPQAQRCLACQQSKHRTDFSTTPAGLSSYCQDCQRASSRLASRRRQAAVRLLIALHPEEYQALLGLVHGRHQLGTTWPKGGGRDAT